MSHCLNPRCDRPQNPLSAQFCQHCGTAILLQQRYRPLTVIGQGAFGRTFRAHDEQQPTQPTCAIKQFYPDTQNFSPKAAELFAREAAQLRILGQHPQIPALYAYCEQAGHQYIVQELIAGETLQAELARRGSLSTAEVRRVLQDLLPVLAFIHGHGAIHRDIKPDNLIRRQSDGRLVLIDFGAAKEAIAQTRQPGTIIGTPDYMAREQRHGKPTYASDLYSLGVTSLQLLTGLPPAELFDPYTGTWCWREYLPQPVSRELGRLLDGLVQERGRDRYQNATAALQALNPPSRPQHPVKMPMMRRRGVKAKTALERLLSRRRFLTGLAGGLVGIWALNPWRWPRLKFATSAGVNLVPATFSFRAVTVAVTGQIIAERPGNAAYIAEALTAAASLRLVAIAPGRFSMGSPPTEVGRFAAESPQHRVRVESFYLSEFPITRSQWQAVVSQVGRIERDLALEPLPLPEAGVDNPADLPIGQVSWYEAVEFCARLSQLTGQEYRLPSEAEWEYACRAGTTTPFHFGPTLTADLANYDGQVTDAIAPPSAYRRQPMPRNTFTYANDFGLLAMHGNVWEWCADLWHEDYQARQPRGGFGSGAIAIRA
ncbi:MAG: SUMF1/EgtB/PvdO family nonheme iron enzyme [Spirulinaceae cyanobacterium SM2_1_0]|nr:SUMF1/EgtB/PvdO family nonheme iron enzyme [Spirulinaceae cyanobacterium SM2_1_0]